jgi:stearoyl-CoA desaturase (delta-9 desaturase)
MGSPILLAMNVTGNAEPVTEADVQDTTGEVAVESIKRMSFWKSIPFWGVHLVAIIGVIMSGWSWTGFALAVALYYVRMFGITGGYHRYFSHRAFKAGRGMQFFLALLGTTATQKGVLWWAAHHRKHHKVSDQPGDIHSVKQDGLWHSHVGWILSPQHDATDWQRIKDFQKFPELRWLNTYHVVPPIVLAVGLYLVGGWWALLWGFMVSTTLLWHGTFTINSLSHVFGRRRYETTDDSKNNWFLALLTIGEGWHNNHHYYQRAANNGFYWWEVDITYYVLKALSWVGLVSDLHRPPERVRAWRGGGRPAPAGIEVHAARNAAAAAAVTAAAALAPVVHVQAPPAVSPPGMVQQ